MAFVAFFLQLHMMTYRGDFMSNLKSIEPNQLVMMGTLVGLAISEDLDIDEMNIMASFLSIISGVLTTKATQLGVQEEIQDSMQQIEDMQSQIDKLRKKLT